MIALVEQFRRLTVGELLELLHQYVEENGLSLDSSVEAVLFDLDNPDSETSYPATMLACHPGKRELYLYAAKTELQEPSNDK